LGQRQQGASRAIAEAVQGNLQTWQQDVNPLVGLALAHPEQTTLDDLETVGLEVSEQEEQALLGRGQRAVFVDAKLACGTGFAIESPSCHMGLKGVLKGLNELPKLVWG
jgi:hypothetical protein